jgi:hypothetical protein
MVDNLYNPVTFIKKAIGQLAMFPREYENYSEKTYIQAVGFDWLLRPIQSKPLNVDQ